MHAPYVQQQLLSFEESNELTLIGHLSIHDATGCHGKQVKLYVNCLLPEASSIFEGDNNDDDDHYILVL